MNRSELITVAEKIENNPSLIFANGHHFQSHHISIDGLYLGSKLCIYWPGCNVYLDTHHETLSTADGIECNIHDSSNCDNAIYLEVMEAVKESGLPVPFFEG
jgi:hypothetical protein